MSKQKTGTRRAQCDETTRILQSVTEANERLAEAYGGQSQFAVIIVPEDIDTGRLYRANLVYPSGRILFSVCARVPELAARGVVELTLDGVRRMLRGEMPIDPMR